MHGTKATLLSVYVISFHMLCILCSSKVTIPVIQEYDGRYADDYSRPPYIALIDRAIPTFN